MNKAENIYNVICKTSSIDLIIFKIQILADDMMDNRKKVL